MRYFSTFSATVLIWTSILVHGQLLYGVDYGINQFSCPTLEDMKNDFNLLKPYTNRVRIFGLSLCNQGANAIEAARNIGMRLFLGLWIDKTDSFEKEIIALQRIVESNVDLGLVDGIIVGSEALYRDDVTQEMLIESIRRVKSITMQSKGVPISTADVYYTITPAVASETDFIMMNAFPFWENVANVDQGVDALLSHYYETVQRLGKPVKISETGWPSAGYHAGSAVTSPENQKRYLEKVICRTRKEGIDVIWFSAIDEPYKEGVEAHFGLLDSNRQLKNKYLPLGHC